MDAREYRAVHPSAPRRICDDDRRQIGGPAHPHGKRVISSPMSRKSVELATKIRRLKRCLDEVRYRERAPTFARDALAILDKLDFKDAETRKLLASLCDDDGTDKNAMMARCHVVLGKEAFLAAERRYWKHAPSADSPFLSARFGGEEPFFAPSQHAMDRAPAAKPRKSNANYATAISHFEKANALFPDPWHRLTPKNLHLAGELNCDPCMPSFYLAVIALRNGDLPGARARFKKVWQAPKIRSGTDGAVTRGALHVNAATFEGVAAILQGRLDDAKTALAQARRVDPQHSSFLKNQGYLFEKLGEPKKAVAAYREALDWDRDRYTTRRVALAEAQGAMPTARVIALRRPSDFHAKFAEIAAALRAIHKSKRAPQPLPEAAIAAVRLAARREGATPTVRLPESVKTILRHDRNFALWPDHVPLLRSIVAAVRSKRAVLSADIDRLVRTDKWTPYAKAFKKLPARVPIWNDDPKLPACIPLHSHPHGEQLLFLYVGKADDHGEYPIARYEAQPELWVAEASLIHLIVSQAVEAGVRIECAFDFEKLSKKAERRNEIYDERPSDDPRVRAIVDAD
jgi:tetratricopeptide (TPR) repeat protein